MLSAQASYGHTALVERGKSGSLEEEEGLEMLLEMICDVDKEGLMAPFAPALGGILRDLLAH